MSRPPFIIATKDVPAKPSRPYPKSDEARGNVRDIGRAAGLERIGIHIVHLPPGRRTSWPHAEEKEEELVYVLDGDVDAWIDGELYPMTKGDFAAFPAGTGIAHTFINNSNVEATLLVGGEANKDDNRIFYPLHPTRREDLSPDGWWDDAPARPLGPHDGLPDAQRR